MIDTLQKQTGMFFSIQQEVYHEWKPTIHGTLKIISCSS